MRRGVKFTAITVLLGALLLFSTFQVKAASSSSVSDVIINERVVISDLEFQVSMDSVSNNSVIDVPQYYTYDRYKYKTVCQPENGNQPDVITCRLYKYDAGTLSASTSQQDYDINAAHTDDLTLNLTETFGQDVQFTYNVKHIYQIIFTDDNTHTGYIQYSSNASLKLLSDNENVGVNGTKIYFFNKGTFSVYYTEQYTQESTINPDANEDITLTTFHEADSGADFGDVIEALDVIDDDIVDIYNYISKRFDWDIPVESFSFNWALFYNLGDSIQSIRNQDYWQKYPIFTVPSNTQIASVQGAAGKFVDIIIGINQNIINSTLSNYFSVNRGTLEFQRHIVQFSPSYRFIHFRILSSEDGTINLTYTGGSTAKLIGIYMKRSDQNLGMSQDFQDIWFSNISDDKSDEMEDIIDDFDDAAGDLSDLEDDAADDLDSSLTNLDLNPDILSSEAFISSGNFIKNMFDRLVLNTPLQPILLLALTLGVASIFIGRNR